MEESKPAQIEIDLRRRETEAGWNRVIDTFALEATPKWFEWLGWVLVIAAFQYLADQSGSQAIHLIVGLSTTCWPLCGLHLRKLQILRL